MRKLRGMNTQQTYRLHESPLARGGEGEIFATNDSRYLAKIYYKPNRDTQEKLKVMIENPTTNETRDSNHTYVAWPIDLLISKSNQFVGYLMPNINNCMPMHEICVAKTRNRKAAGFNWYYLHTAALNYALCMGRLHQHHYVVADIKTQNVLVDINARVTIVDSDSFQIRNPQTDQVYLCPVGSEGFTPPELIGGRAFSKNIRTEEQDRFGMAVVIFYLLFGYHPFHGKFTKRSNPPTTDQHVRNGDWLFKPQSAIVPTKTTIPLDVIHPSIQSCFRRCFTLGHTSPKTRPSAREWSRALKAGIEDLTLCSENENHHYSQQYGSCYWCQRSHELNYDAFEARNGSSPRTKRKHQSYEPSVSSLIEDFLRNQRTIFQNIKPIGSLFNLQQSSPLPLKSSYKFEPISIFNREIKWPWEK